jgi:hypothetical protein
MVAWGNFMTARIAILVLILSTTAAAFAGTDAFDGVELRIADETVPPGGMLQLKLEITEPKPILKGGQRNRFNAKFLGDVQGISLFSLDGDASGAALLSKGTAQFSLSSPLTSMGESADYPIVTMAIPVKPSAKPGQTANLTLDPSWSDWIDPNGQRYPVMLADGLLTVGGKMSIANIVPGGGVVKAGTKIAIQGIGFQPDFRVQVNEATVATSTYVSANEIDVTLTADVNMTTRRVRVTNRSDNERVEYYSYQRTSPIGYSQDPLFSKTAPLFSQKTWKVAYLKPVLTSSQYTGVAMQNETATASTVRLKLLAGDGKLIAKKTVVLGPSQKIVRSLYELLGVQADSGTTVKAKILSGPPVQMLGLLADSTLGTVDPQDFSPAP